MEILVDTNYTLSETNNVWSCFNLDWWPSTKCDYGVCPWYNDSILNVNLNSKMLRNAVEAFEGNVHLRLGGSMGDFVIYNTTGTSSKYCQYSDFSPPTNTSRLGYEIFSGCLNMERWDALNEFCVQANCSILFGVNALYGRNLPGPCEDGVNCRDKPTAACCTNWTGLWDSSQLKPFLEYTFNKKYTIYAYEFGNELVGDNGIESHISVSDYMVDWMQFLDILRSVYAGSDSTTMPLPRVVIPDGTYEEQWFSDFLNSVPLGYEPDIVTHHLYSLGPGSDEDAWMKTLDPASLDQVQVLGKEVQETVTTSACSSAEIWLGEGGGAYNSGRDGVTNSFNSGFWYLDQMGSFATTGHKSYCRQTLVGGNYGMLDWITYEPNPDFYSLLLWSRLMGPRVLAAKTGEVQHTGDGSGSGSNLRAYCHCTRKSASSPQSDHTGVTVLLINLSNTTEMAISNISLTTATVSPALITKSATRSAAFSALLTSANDSHSLNILSTGDRIQYILSSACEGDEMVMLACRQMHLNGVLLSSSNEVMPALEGQVVSQQSVGNNVITMQPLTYGYFVFPDVVVDICM